MFFFCPLDNPRSAQPTTLERERAIAPDWHRARPGLVINAATKREASLTLEAYLIDCHRSGRPGFQRSVEIKEVDGVPVATMGHWPGLGDDGPAIQAMIDTAKRRLNTAKPIADSCASV